MHDTRTGLRVDGPSWLCEADPQNPSQLGLQLDARRPDPRRLPRLPDDAPRPRWPTDVDSLPPERGDALAALRYVFRNPTLEEAHVTAARKTWPFRGWFAAFVRIAAIRRVVLGGQPASEPDHWPILDRLADALEATGTASGVIDARTARGLARDPAARADRWYPPLKPNSAFAGKRSRASHPSGVGPSRGADSDGKRPRHSY